jgi:hypothetical protein
VTCFQRKEIERWGVAPLQWESSSWHCSKEIKVSIHRHKSCWNVNHWLTGHNKKGTSPLWYLLKYITPSNEGNMKQTQWGMFYKTHSQCSSNLLSPQKTWTDSHRLEETKKSWWPQVMWYSVPDPITEKRARV